jgi:thiamine biosynthesis protein ThiS
MLVKINGVETQVDDSSTVADIAQLNDASKTGSAIAVNDKLVRRQQWQLTKVNEGDNIVIIKAAYGG